MYYYFVLLFYFTHLYELFDYNLLYKVSKLYSFILKLNSDQNYIILYLIFLIVIIYNRLQSTNFFIFYLFFCLVTFNLKLNLFGTTALDNNINKNLLNGLLIIHPILLYSSYGMLFYVVYINIYLKFKFLFFNKSFNLKKQHYFQTVVVLLASIFLGSW